MERKLIGEFQKNSRETLRVSVQTYNGHPLVDVRIWIRLDGGDWIPTKKGISIDPELLPQLLDLLKEAHNAYEHA